MNAVLDPREQARLLYFQGYRTNEISDKLKIPYQTVNTWKRRDEWDSTPVVKRVETSIDNRLTMIIAKPEKTDTDLKEIETLTRALMRTARIRKFDMGGNESDLNPKVKNRNRGNKKKPEKNLITLDQEKQLRTAFNDDLFQFQRVWKDSKLTYRIRNILKSRQIGATWYFAREAIIDAMDTGDNQIFLSASKAQAHVFKQYIIQFVKDVTGVELKGDPLILPNGATLYFLGTNARTAQSYHGHLYLDEYFWIQRFQEFRKVASGMAMHKKWRQTYFSTPSTLGHEAYPFWSGQLFNKGRAKNDHINVDISHQNLVNGMLCGDGQWKQIVTVEDAMAGGCDLFDIDQLKREYAPDEYNNLLMCQFVDDNASVFSLNDLQRGAVDAWEVWEDLKPFAKRPLGDVPVWLGYDPSRTRDDASLSVIAPPRVPGGKFRLIEKMAWNNVDFAKQAKNIQDITKRYNVQHIGIDASGIGYGVYDLVKQFYPAAVKINYSVEVKNRLVLKAMNVISAGRLEYDAGLKEVPMAFMTIHRTTTPSGGQMTFQASRTEQTGHADLAWSIMHALDKEPLQAMDGTTGQSKSIVEIYE